MHNVSYCRATPSLAHKTQDITRPLTIQRVSTKCVVFAGLGVKLTNSLSQKKVEGG